MQKINNLYIIFYYFTTLQQFGKNMMRNFWRDFAPNSEPPALCSDRRRNEQWGNKKSVAV